MRRSKQSSGCLVSGLWPGLVVIRLMNGTNPSPPEVIGAHRANICPPAPLWGNLLGPAPTGCAALPFFRRNREIHNSKLTPTWDPRTPGTASDPTADPLWTGPSRRSPGSWPHVSNSRASVPAFGQWQPNGGAGAYNINPTFAACQFPSFLGFATAVIPGSLSPPSGWLPAATRPRHTPGRRPATCPSRTPSPSSSASHSGLRATSHRRGTLYRRSKRRDRFLWTTSQVCDSRLLRDCLLCFALHFAAACRCRRCPPSIGRPPYRLS